LWPYKYVAWTLKKLIKDGKLNLQTGTAVEKIEPIESSESTARYKIHTSRGTVTAKHLLLATNAYTSHLLPSFADLIVPVRETMTALLPPESMDTLLPHSYGFVGFGTDPNPNATEYLIQRPFTGPTPNGHLMLGGGRLSAATLPSVGEADDSILDPSVVEYLTTVLPRAIHLSPASPPPALTPVAAWTGIWAASRDNVPWVGPVPGSARGGLWLCAAYTGHGMPNATLCARAVVRMMVAEEKGEEEWGRVVERMVAGREIPASYVLSEERMGLARGLPSVEVQDREIFGFFDRGLVTGDE
jgi:glycine/D-amino acid oxidase-like deaminating enzyme